MIGIFDSWASCITRSRSLPSGVFAISSMIFRLTARNFPKSSSNFFSHFQIISGSEFWLIVSFELESQGRFLLYQGWQILIHVSKLQFPILHMGHTVWSVQVHYRFSAMYFSASAFTLAIASRFSSQRRSTSDWLCWLKLSWIIFITVCECFAWISSSCSRRVQRVSLFISNICELGSPRSRSFIPEDKYWLGPP